MDAGLSVTAQERPALLESLYYGVFCIAVCLLGRVVRVCGARLLARSIPRQPFHNAESTLSNQNIEKRSSSSVDPGDYTVNWLDEALTAPLSTSFGLWKIYLQYSHVGRHHHQCALGRVHIVTTYSVHRTLLSKTEVSRVNLKERAVVDLAIHTSDGDGKASLSGARGYMRGMP